MQETIDAMISALAERAEIVDAERVDRSDVLDWVQNGIDEHVIQPDGTPYGWTNVDHVEYITDAGNLPAEWVPHGNGDYGIAESVSDSQLLSSFDLPPVDEIF